MLPDFNEYLVDTGTLSAATIMESTGGSSFMPKEGKDITSDQDLAEYLQKVLIIREKLKLTK